MDRRSVKLAAPILTVVSIKIVHLDLVAILVSLMVSLVGIVNQWVSLKISPPTPRRRAVELPSRLVDRPPTPLCPASPLPPMPAPSTAPAGSVAPPMSVVPPPVTAPVAIPVRMGTAPAAPRPALPAVATVCRRVGAVRPRRVTMPKAARPGVDPTKPVIWSVISKSPAPPPIPVPTPRVPSVGRVVSVLRIVVGVGEGGVVRMPQQPSPTSSPQVQLPRAFRPSPGEHPLSPPVTI
jgi:hypothetical protein